MNLTWEVILMPIFRRKIIIAAFVFALPALWISLGGAAHSAPSTNLRKGPYLALAAKNCTANQTCQTDSTKMTVLWQTDRTPASPRGCCKLEWGDGPDSYVRGAATVCESGSAVDEHQFSYTISGLEPGTLTYYRVTCDGYRSPDPDSPDFAAASFRTPPPDDQTSLTFYAYGDTRGYPGRQKTRQRQVIANILYDMKQSADRQTFCLHLGDFVAAGQAEFNWDNYEDQEYFSRRFPVMKEFLNKLPVMGALGNHEGYMPSPVNPLKSVYDYINFGNFYKKYFPYAFYVSGADRFYYSFDYGPVHFIVIDANYRDSARNETGLDASAAGLKPGSEQYEWLKNDIARATKDWIVVMIHNPLYAAGALRDRFQGNQGQEIRDRLHNLFLTQASLITGEKVKLVLQGHDHYYAHCRQDGIQYLVIGGGGATLGDPDPTICSPAVKVYHFVRFSVVGKVMTVRVMDSKDAHQGGPGLVETFSIDLP
jgi:hypothetical protein